MNEHESLLLLGKVGAVVTQTHIVYTSGKHGSSYINKDALYPYTHLTSRLCRKIAHQFLKSGVEVVIAPAIGGVILSQWVAYHLTELGQHEVLAVYAEKDELSSNFIIKRGYDKIINGKKVLVVEDVLTTGGSVKKVVAAVKAAGGSVVGVGALCNRGGITLKDMGDVPVLNVLFEISLDSWDQDKCPLCAKAVPINVELGKGMEFLAKKNH
jgi:orotate phosphoribosyltransferase